MNPREKMLASAVVTLLVLSAVWAGVRWGVIARWTELNKRIQEEERRAVRLEGKLLEARAAERRWAALRPLSHNADRATQRFRQDLSELLEQHGMQDDFTIRVLPQRKLKVASLKSKKVNFIEVRLSIQARGTLQQVMNFLCDFYRRDYLSRLDQLTLTAEDSPGRSRAVLAGRTRGRLRRGRTSRRSEGPSYGPEGPTLNVSMLATALVLPEAKGLEQPVVTDPATPTDPKTLGRLPRPAAEYAKVWDTNIFKLYQPPVAKAVSEPKKPSTPRPAPETPKVAASPPAEPRPNKKVVAVCCLHGKLMATLRDEDHRELPLEKVTINDPVDDGTLVLVVPQGMVVQVVEDRGATADIKYYFYRLGTTFAERVELDPNEYPDIAQQLELVLVPQETR